MQKTTLNQIFLLISLIPCCNTLNAMEKRTKKTTTATSTTIHRHSLRSKGNNTLFHNTNLITRTKASPKIARAKAAPKKSLKALPLPSSPTKHKNQKNYTRQNNVPIDVLSPATEESTSSSDETDNSSIDVFSAQEGYESLRVESLLPSGGLYLEDLFSDMDVQAPIQYSSYEDLAFEMGLQDFLLKEFNNL